MQYLKLFVVEGVEPEVELDEVHEDGVQVRVKLEQNHFPEKEKKSYCIKRTGLETFKNKMIL